MKVFGKNTFTIKYDQHFKFKSERLIVEHTDIYNIALKKDLYYRLTYKSIHMIKKEDKKKKKKERKKKKE